MPDPSATGAFALQTPQRPAGAASFRLIETMRAGRGRVEHLERHLARVQRSARRFGFAPVQAAALRAAARACAAACAGPAHRLRLTLGSGGGLGVEASALGTPPSRPGEPLHVTLAAARAHSADPFFRHKTTWRRVYRQSFAAAQAGGFGEALLLNERGEVTEGTRANLFAEIGGRLYTPPVRCGLLAGIGRAAWLEEAGVAERVLYPADVEAAERLWLVSALRGRRRAVWDGEP